MCATPPDFFLSYIMYQTVILFSHMFICPTFFPFILTPKKPLLMCVVKSKIMRMTFVFKVTHLSSAFSCPPTDKPNQYYRKTQSYLHSFSCISRNILTIYVLFYDVYCSESSGVHVPGKLKWKVSWLCLISTYLIYYTDLLNPASFAHSSH